MILGLVICVIVLMVWCWQLDKKVEQVERSHKHLIDHIMLAKKQIEEMKLDHVMLNHDYQIFAEHVRKGAYNNETTTEKESN